MKPYICLLRSVNVSGVNIIKMAALKTFFESLRFQNVATYIQSGNVLFNSEEMPSPSYLEEKIQEKFNTKNVAVVLKTPEELTEIIEQNPFKHHPNLDPKKHYVHFLETIPEEPLTTALSNISFKHEFFIVMKNVIYVYYEADQSRAKLSNAFFEKKLRTRATARNWNTTNTLLSLSLRKE
jgi:uncharacterized protein (DUF1697 family)